jgi:hypothetical protein
VTVGRELSFRQDLSAETEESPLLETVTREQAGKDLAGSVLICGVWK